MKKTLITLTAVVLFVAGSAQAAVYLQIDENPDPVSGLKSYTVTAKSTAGENITLLSNIYISSGSVHNVWPTAGSVKTPTVDDWAEGMFVDPAWAVYDTYMLIPDADKVGILGPPLDEANDGSNPAGLSLVKGTLSALCGMGGYGHGITGDPASSFGLIPAIQGSSVPFLQVVYPNPTEEVWLHARVVFDEGGGVYAGEDFNVLVIPEPATMVLLGLGGIGVLIRRRRRA